MLFLLLLFLLLLIAAAVAVIIFVVSTPSPYNPNPNPRPCRYTLSAMCGMHVHTTKTAKAQDVLDICLAKFKELVASFCIKYPEAAVNEFLLFTTLTKTNPIEGKQVYAMSKQVRKQCVNKFNRMWDSCLNSGGSLPSGKDWKWVRPRQLMFMNMQMMLNTCTFMVY
jgi:hypothetical protein